MKKSGLFISLLVLLLNSLTFAANGDLGTSNGANGTESAPFLIEDFADFQAFCADTSKWAAAVHTRLEIDLDLDPALEGRQTYTQAPIAGDTNADSTFDGTPYSGIFDGNGHVISNLTVNGVYYCGLFGKTESDCQIINLGVIDSDIIGTGYHIGSLVGYIYYSSIINSYSSGNITGTDVTGGLCGRNYYGILTDCYSSSYVAGNRYIGGLCGQNLFGSISYSYSSGSVSGSDFSVGGLCGYNDDSNITSCYATGSVSGEDGVGGLVGDNFDSSISSCYATGSVSGSRNFVGGLVGDNFNSSVTSCYATGSVSGARDFVGGLVGENFNSSVTSCYATGSVSGFESVGGLCGYNDGNITSCYATGSVSGEGMFVGGLCGFNFFCSITFCYATGPVSGSIGVGGLCGYNDGNITSCYATGSVSAKDNPGDGLCGYNNEGSISLCFWDTETSGIADPEAGMVDTDCIVGLTTAKMKDFLNFEKAGWIQANYKTGRTGWYMPENSYPLLVWQNLDAVKVPDVSGLPLAQAQSILETTGITVNNVINVNSWQIPAGLVVGASASSGGYFDQSEYTIDIYVSSGSCGDGSVENPYEVSSQVDLQAINNAPDVCYIMTADINMSTTDFNNYLISEEFTGIFDGNDHKISNLISSNGLFKSIGVSGCINNLGIDKLFKLEEESSDFLGVLAGSSAGRVVNCFTTGIVTGEISVGGLIGDNTGIVKDCYSKCYVEGVDCVGGLIGENSGSVYYCYSTGSLFGERYDSGGLVGHNSGIVRNCFSTGNVKGQDWLGGLVGNNFGSISNCYFTGNIVGEDGVGGLLGIHHKEGAVSNCYSTGSVEGVQYVGGLIGACGGMISNSFSSGSVSGYDYTGGLCGYNYRGSISYSYSSGSVTGDNFTGGLCGYQDGSSAIINCLWDIETSGYSIGYKLSSSYPGTITNVQGLTTTEMQTQATFTNAGWDFNAESANGTEDLWHMPFNTTGYPMLYWQRDIPGDLTGSYGINLSDFSELSNDWLDTYDLTDLQTLTANWLSGN